MHTLIMTTEVDFWVPTIESFGVRLVLVRHQMGWNAKEAALACGIAAQNWREWEQSGRRPRDYEGVCKQIAERTKCDLIWLMTGLPSSGWPSAPSQIRTDDLRITMSDIIGQAMRRVGARGTPHALRHWTGSTLLDDGADLRTIQEILRHRQLNTTAIYTRVPDLRRHEAVNRLDPYRGVA